MKIKAVKDSYDDELVESTILSGVVSGVFKFIHRKLGKSE